MHINANIRIPLINPVTAVIYPLDINGTWDEDPPGTPAQGYDPILREPYTSWNSNRVRASTRQEGDPLYVPCQVEIKKYEELTNTFGGNDPVTNIALIIHRFDLNRLSLINATTGNTTLKPGDRIASFRQGARTIKTFQKPLYIFEVRPESWGAGPDGFDLEIIYTTYREASPE